MSDPIEHLRHFTPGVDVDPLPASEVRRRGDRRRRRTHALVTAGGVTAVAALVIPLALVVQGTNRSAPEPGFAGRGSATPSTGVEWLQRIPVGLDLAGQPSDATFSYTVREAPVVDDLTLCGVPLFATGPDGPAGASVDAAGASWAEQGSDAGAGRTLALYPDDLTAGRALAALEDGVRACPVERQPPGAPLVQEPVATELPTDESFVYTQQSRMGGGLLADLTVVQVARVGNALFLSSSHLSAGGPEVAKTEVSRLARLSAPVLSDLCVFAAHPCDGPGAKTAASSDTTDAGGPVSAVPADFPLLDGYPSEARAESPGSATSLETR